MMNAKARRYIARVARAVRPLDRICVNPALSPFLSAVKMLSLNSGAFADLAERPSRP